MNFSSNLKELRLHFNRTQKDMAILLDITERGYRNYEMGTREPDIKVLIHIADLFGVTLDDLVGRSIPENPLMDIK